MYAPTILNGRMRLGDGVKLAAQAPYYRLFAVEDGVHKIQQDHQYATCGPGSVYLVKPGHPLRVEKSPTSRAIMVAFTVIACPLLPASKRPDGRPLCLPPDSDPQPEPSAVWGIDFPMLLSPAVSIRIQPQLHSVVASWWWSKERHFWANRRLANVLGDIYDAYATEPHSPPSQDWQSDWLQNLLARIDEQLAELRSAADLQTLSGLSSSQLHRVFKETLGDSPGAYLRKRRLNLAAELMKDHGVSIRDVANMLGYSSQSAFGNAWRKQYGVSPQHWKKLAHSPV